MRDRRGTGPLWEPGTASGYHGWTFGWILGRYAKGLGYFLGLPAMAGERTAFGHHGSGGSIAFADRGRGLAFCLTRTRPVAGAADTAARTLADEIRAAVTPAEQALTGRDER
ncbi:hypothetical protein [Streptomyces sp. NBC_01233]|uniref:hypothetical protein n=1 Tax=Streptomyces sp. NBC_01233 TaxID=2903787 RepID=UPI002E0E3E53|nr:hypothetical protein OG332_01690 [Streptomyces sp. NBC_01233]